MAAMTDLATQIEQAGPEQHAEEMWRLVYPEPERGPWYWRSKEWLLWRRYLGYFEVYIQHGLWLKPLRWLYPGGMPDMIASDPKKAFAACVRAHDKENG